MLLKGLFIGAIVSAPLGPIGILCLQRTLNKGKAHGFATGLGATLSDLIYAMMAAFSMSFVINFIEEHLLILKVIGCIVVFGFGLHTYRDNPVARLRQMNKGQSSLVSDCLSSFGMTITNPMVIFLFIAMFAKFSFMTENMTLMENGLCILSILGGAFLWWMLIVNAVDHFRSKFNLRGLAIVNKGAGAVLMVLSVGTLVWAVIEACEVV